jgi:hypothetical protein
LEDNNHQFPSFFSDDILQFNNPSPLQPNSTLSALNTAPSMVQASSDRNYSGVVGESHIGGGGVQSPNGVTGFTNWNAHDNDARGIGNQRLDLEAGINPVQLQSVKTP